MCYLLFLSNSQFVKYTSTFQCMQYAVINIYDKLICYMLFCLFSQFLCNNEKIVFTNLVYNGGKDFLSVKLYEVSLCNFWHSSSRSIQLKVTCGGIMFLSWVVLQLRFTAWTNLITAPLCQMLQNSPNNQRKTDIRKICLISR